MDPRPVCQRASDQRERVFARAVARTVGGDGAAPIPGRLGISDDLTIDGFSGLMDEQTVYAVETIRRRMTFYVSGSVSGIITLIGYFVRRRENDRSI